MACAVSTSLAPNLVGVIIWFQGPPGFDLFDCGDGHFDVQGFFWTNTRAAGQFKGMGGRMAAAEGLAVAQGRGSGNLFPLFAALWRRQDRSNKNNNFTKNPTKTSPQLTEKGTFY